MERAPWISLLSHDPAARSSRSSANALHPSALDFHTPRKRPGVGEGCLPPGRPRIWKPGDSLPSKAGIYGHIFATTKKPYRLGSTFDAADRVPDHLAHPKLRNMPVRLQIARDDVTPEQLQAAEG